MQLIGEMIDAQNIIDGFKIDVEGDNIDEQEKQEFNMILNKLVHDISAKNSIFYEFVNELRRNDRDDKNTYRILKDRL